MHQQLMMNSDPTDNDNTSSPPDNCNDSNWPICHLDSLDRLKTSFSQRLCIGPNDVLCGRSKTSFNHVGNRLFRTIVSGALEEYTQANSKWAKSMVAAKLVGMIHRDGGRFLKQRQGNTEDWYELTAQEAKAKASHAIRDCIAARDKTKAMKTLGTEVSKPAAKTTAKPKKDSSPQTVKPKKKVPPTSKMQAATTAAVPSSSISRASSFPLSSIPGPMFSMGGPHHPSRFGGDATNHSATLDQIQHIQSHSGGFSFPGLLQQQHDILGGNQVQHYPHQRSLANSMLRPQLREEMQESKQGSGSNGGSAINHIATLDQTQHIQSHSGGFSFPGLPQQQHDLLGGNLLQHYPHQRSLSNGMPRPQLREEMQESKHGSGSDNDDLDRDFLSLIDNVLGPLNSPKRNSRGL